MNKTYMTLMTTILLSSLPIASSMAFCFKEAGRSFGVDPVLMRAICKTESNFKPQAISHNKDGSLDVGICQINSFWFDKLRARQIDINSLLEPCTNILVGAWILSEEIKRHGKTWAAVGAYHTGALKPNDSLIKIKRNRQYAWKVYKNLSND